MKSPNLGIKIERGPLREGLNMSGLFSGNLVSLEYGQKKLSIKFAASMLTVDAFEAASADEIVEEILGQHEFKAVDVLFDEMSPGSAQPTDRGSIVYLRVPTKGRTSELMLRPAVHAPLTAIGQFDGDGFVQFVIEEKTADAMTRKYKNLRSVVSATLESINREFESYNQVLRDSAKHCVAERMKQLDAHKQLVEALPFPIKRRDEVPSPLILPKTKRQVTIEKAKAQRQESKTRSEPEFELAMAEYDFILKVIGDMSKVMECSPKAFSTLDEEPLRWVLLVPLNGHYEGGATGETFSVEGKSDILIMHGGQKIFLAECKIWRGSEEFREAIDQLLKYCHWRDTKTALIVFNRLKNFSKVLESMNSTVLSHDHFLKKIDYASETGARYLFKHPTDPDKHMYLTTLAFDVSVRS